MGLTYVEGKISGKGKSKESISFWVDSGASYTLLPKKAWKKLGLKAKRTETFILTDGTEIRRDLSECHIEILEKDGHTPVILGEDGDEALWGVITREEFGFVLNPFSRTLQSMKLRLA